MATQSTSANQRMAGESVAPGDAGLDVAGIRSRFSALSRELAGSPVVYLDGPGGSQAPDTVVRAVADYMLVNNANAGGAFATSQATDRLLDDARVAGADFLGCTFDEVIFGANTTTINFSLAHALARTLEPGDEVLVTELDHDANVSPWLVVAADRGLVVHTAPLNRLDGTLDESALEARLSPRTRVVACTLASNALGSVVDIPRVASAAHDAGALVWLDGVHLAPHRRLNLADLGADVLLTSAYKYFGPHLGVAAVRSESPARSPPTACDPPSRCRSATVLRPALSPTKRSPASWRPSSTWNRWGPRPMTVPAGWTWPTRESRPTNEH